MPRLRRMDCSDQQQEEGHHLVPACLQGMRPSAEACRGFRANPNASATRTKRSRTLRKGDEKFRMPKAGTLRKPLSPVPTSTITRSFPWSRVSYRSKKRSNHRWRTSPPSTPFRRSSQRMFPLDRLDGRFSPARCGTESPWKTWDNSSLLSLRPFARRFEHGLS